MLFLLGDKSGNHRNFIFLNRTKQRKRKEKKIPSKKKESKRNKRPALVNSFSFCFPHQNLKRLLHIFFLKNKKQPISENHLSKTRNRKHNTNDLKKQNKKTQLVVIVFVLLVPSQVSPFSLVCCKKCSFCSWKLAWNKNNDRWEMG